jgi:hypothetical protein
MWTKELIINTGKSIETVKLSNWKPQMILNHSLSIHLNKFIVTGILLKPTSAKAKIANIVVIITFEHVIICAPLTPTFLPKKPDTIDPNKGKIIILKYIIYIVLLYFLFVLPQYSHIETDYILS